jgi:16S rRNA (cytosine1402-N4)-methyltransferase
VIPIHSPFSLMKERLAELKIEKVDAVIMDVGKSLLYLMKGTSNFQLRDSSRGFSFGLPGPLDMRMDPGTSSSSIPASVIINYFDEEQIGDILLKYGEENQAKRIAGAICTYRQTKVIESTTELSEIIGSRLI